MRNPYSAPPGHHIADDGSFALLQTTMTWTGRSIYLDDHPYAQLQAPYRRDVPHSSATKATLLSFAQAARPVKRLRLPHESLPSMSLLHASQTIRRDVGAADTHFRQ